MTNSADAQTKDKYKHKVKFYLKKKLFGPCVFPLLGASPSVLGIPKSISRMLELAVLYKDKRTDKTHLDPLSTETAHLG